MRITKAKVKNRSLEIEYTEKNTLINPDGNMLESTRDLAVKCYDICHDSLVEAFNRLKPHAALIADVREALKIELQIEKDGHFEHIDLEELKTLSITGFVIVGNEDDGSEGVMIILQKTTGTRVLNITTPVVKFEDADYAYCGELQRVINDCISEVEEYLDGKVAIKQLEMQFDEGFDSESNVAEVKAPKKKGKKAKSLAEAFGLDPAEVSMTASFEPSISEHQDVA